MSIDKEFEKALIERIESRYFIPNHTHICANMNCFDCDISRLCEKTTRENVPSIEEFREEIAEHYPEYLI